jgi:hypothetical protein
MLEITEYLFEIISFAMFIGLSAAILAQRLAIVRLRDMLRSEHADRQALEQDFMGLLSCSRNIGKRVQSHDMTQVRVLKKLDVITHADLEDDGNSFAHVHKLVEKGLGIDEIGAIYDLGRGEMDLLNHIALHRSAA